MGTVFKKTVTRAFPVGAEIFERKGQRFARWKDSKGKTRTAPLTVGADGSDRIVTEAGTFTAKYRDGSGWVCETATGCRDADAARAVLGDLERRSELVKAGVMTAAEDAVADHQLTPLVGHIADFIAYLRGRETSSVRVANMEAQFLRVNTDCEFKQLADLNEAKLTAWLVEQAAGKGKMSAATRNEYRKAFVGFCNWCLRSRRLSFNPLAHVPKANEKADPRRQRRALTEAELVRLLTVAQWRPLAEYGRERLKLDKTAEPGEKPKRSAWTYSPLEFVGIETATCLARERLRDKPTLVAKLERLGRERALIYKTLVLTGLRKAELASLTKAKLSLDGALPFAMLDAADEKNGQGSTLPLRADLAADLRAWLDDRDKPTAAETDRQTIPFSKTLKRDMAKEAAASPLFTVPAALVKILNRDIEAAGIPKRDERGRTVDVHALRHSFGTLLSKGGVSPRTAQAAMRHSKIELTMGVYTDPKLLDVAGAMDCLPSLSLSEKQPEAAKATGTYDLTSCAVAPTVARTPDNQGFSVSFPVTLTADDLNTGDSRTVAVNRCPVKAKDPLITGVNGPNQVDAAGFEPATPTMSR